MSETKPRNPMDWNVGGTAEATCPACGDTRAKNNVLAVTNLLPPHQMLTFANCKRCKTRFIPGYVTPDYGDVAVSDYATRFYIEQGAGVDHLARPAFSIGARGKIARYLEIGCGYGFGVDIAARIFGWDSRGIDPSPIAQQGVADLGIRIDSLHLEPGTEKEIGTFDAIVAIEVIEHIPEPIPFLQTLKAHLAPGGVLFMSTPNGAIIDDRKHPMLAAALSPGYHITMFSRDGLATAMKRAGFDNVSVIASDTTLVAGGTVGGAPIKVDTLVDRDRFDSYLSGRMALHEPGSPLWTGFAYRLYKDLVNRGLYDQAEPVFQELAAALRDKRGIDLMQPRQIIAESPEADAHLHSGRWPFCLTGLLFLRGIQLINVNWAPQEPFPYFLAALDIGNQIRASLQVWGVVDGEMQSQIAAAEGPLAMCLERLRER